jgi:hypothetical protein
MGRPSIRSSQTQRLSRGHLSCGQRSRERGCSVSLVPFRIPQAPALQRAWAQLWRDRDAGPSRRGAGIGRRLPDSGKQRTGQPQQLNHRAGALTAARPRWIKISRCFPRVVGSARALQSRIACIEPDDGSARSRSGKVGNRNGKDELSDDVTRVWRPGVLECAYWVRRNRP